jgi:hypothetical protein
MDSDIIINKKINHQVPRHSVVQQVPVSSPAELVPVFAGPAGQGERHHGLRGQSGTTAGSHVQAEEERKEQRATQDHVCTRDQYGEKILQRVNIL